MGDTATILILSNTKQEFGFFNISSPTIEESEADYPEEIKELTGIISVEVGLVKKIPYC